MTGFLEESILPFNWIIRNRTKNSIKNNFFSLQKTLY